MTETHTPSKTYTVQEYLAMEANEPARKEYVKGSIQMMAGGSKSHGILGNAINAELNLLNRGKPCTTFNGDVKIRIDSHDCFLYPEASVVCGNVESSDQDEHSILNPLLIAEVLSPSTEAYDRGKKFMLYQQLSSFREYILIDQEYPIVNTFFKNDHGIWETFSYLGLDKTVQVRSLEATFEMAILYEKSGGPKAGFWVKRNRLLIFNVHN